MSIRSKAKNVSEIRLGEEKITEVYQGSSLIWDDKVIDFPKRFTIRNFIKDITVSDIISKIKATISGDESGNKCCPIENFIIDDIIYSDFSMIIPKGTKEVKLILSSNLQFSEFFFNSSSVFAREIIFSNESIKNCETIEFNYFGVNIFSYLGSYEFDCKIYSENKTYNFPQLSIDLIKGMTESNYLNLKNYKIIIYFYNMGNFNQFYLLGNNENGYLKDHIIKIVDSKGNEYPWNFGALYFYNYNSSQYSIQFEMYLKNDINSNFSEKYLNSIPKDAFSELKLSNPFVINFGKNSIQSIGENAFFQVSSNDCSIQILGLNDIRYLGESCFKGLGRSFIGSGANIDISYNKLEYIASNAFYNTRLKWTECDLSNAKYIGDDAFRFDENSYVDFISILKLSSDLAKIGSNIFSSNEILCLSSVGYKGNYYYDSESLKQAFEDQGILYESNCISFNSKKRIKYKTQGSILPTTSSSKNAGYYIGSCGTLESNLFEGSSSSGILKFTDELTQIGVGAFFSTSTLTEIEIPNTVTSIESNAFDKCSNLKLIHGLNVSSYSSSPLSLTSIGNFAFYQTSSLERFINESDSIQIGASCFYYSGLSYLVITAQSITFGSNAFEGCSSLNTARFNGTVSSLPSKLFYQCTSLRYLSIGNNEITTIGNESLSGTNLSSFTFPSTLTSISYGEIGSNSCSFYYQGTISEWNSLSINPCFNSSGSIYYSMGRTNRITCSDGVAFLIGPKAVAMSVLTDNPGITFAQLINLGYLDYTVNSNGIILVNTQALYSLGSIVVNSTSVVDSSNYYYFVV